MKNRYQTGKQDIDRQQTVDNIQTNTIYTLYTAGIYISDDRQTYMIHTDRLNRSQTGIHQSNIQQTESR